MIDEFIDIARTCEVTGLSRGHLATLRYTGRGPRFYAPTKRTIRYKQAEVLEWIEASARTGTGEVAA